MEVVCNFRFGDLLPPKCYLLQISNCYPWRIFLLHEILLLLTVCGVEIHFFQAGNIIGLFKVPNHCHKSECQHFEACSYFYIDCVICDFCLISLMYSLILSMLMNHRGNLTFISCHIYTPVKQEMDNI